MPEPRVARHARPTSKKRPIRAAAVTLSLLGALVVAPQIGAEAALLGTGTTDPVTGFPGYYTDQGGLSTQLCLTGDPCAGIAPADPLAAPDGEAFYFLATATIPTASGDVNVEFALEAAFLDATPDSQIVFDRLRVRGPAPEGDYTLEHPFGETPLTSVAPPPVPPAPADPAVINFTDDVGCQVTPCDFGEATGGPITNFLMATGHPTGYLGDGVSATTVTGATALDAGGPRNLVRLLDSAGTVVGETDQFVVSGQQVDGPAASVSPSSVDFGNTADGTRSFDVTNVGTQELTLGGPDAGSGPFAVDAAQTTCGTGTVAVGGSCTVTVHYASAVTDPDANGALTMTTNTVAGPISVALHAMSMPVASVSSGQLAFGSQKVGTTSAARSVRLTNTGGAPMNVGDATASGPFTASDTCGATLAVGASCTAAASYAPTARGAQSGSLALPHAGGPTSVALTGSGTTPLAALSATSLDFGAITVGATSPPKAVRLTNTGDAVMALGPASAGGAFGIASNDCPASLASAASCTVAVTFRPSGVGNGSGTLRLPHDATPGGASVALQGSGAAVVTVPQGVPAPPAVPAPPKSAPRSATAPSAPLIGTASTGKVGAPVTAKVRWAAPATNGGSRITGYRISIRRVGRDVVHTRQASSVARSMTVAGLVKGASYRFSVTAVNARGLSVRSAWSNRVQAR